MSYSVEDYKAMAAAGGYRVECQKEYIRAEKDFTVLRITQNREFEDEYSTWQPDTDPADCFRLAIDAGLDIGCNRTHGYCWAGGRKNDGQPFGKFWEFMAKAQLIDHNNDKLAATMKAVCDVAIQIGSQIGRSE